ncbi:MAG: MFS transporter [Planctomycetota bacterium]|nr:MFS transporter [Planctomycetota bacterium]
MREAAGTKLSVMMFLQFFVWGAWYVTAPNYLGTKGFSADDFSWTYSVGPIAGMIAPLFVGMIADPFFAAQRLLGLLHLAGAGIMYGATTLMLGDSPSPNAINVVFFGYMLTYFPTLSLTNTVAMRSMTDPEKQFPMIRVWGTIGWIAAGLTLSFNGWDNQIDMFHLTTAAGVILGLFSFMLPHTPPTSDKSASIREIIGLDALFLMKDPAYRLFIICSMLICIPLAFYYQIASRVVEMCQFESVGVFSSLADALKMPNVIAAVMSTGQMSEIFFMLVMPLFFRRLGVKWMLAVGMLAWVIRYSLFAFGAPEQIQAMVLSGVLLHGICYDFFFVTGQIYTDQKAPVAIRGQAQGLLVMLTLGLGMLIGAQSAGFVEGLCTTDESKAKAETVTQLGKDIKELEDASEAATEAVQAENTKNIEALTAQKNAARLAELRAIDWQLLWGIPAGFAGAILLIFLLLFHESDTVSREGEDSTATAEA